MPRRPSSRGSGSQLWLTNETSRPARTVPVPDQPGVPRTGRGRRSATRRRRPAHRCRSGAGAADVSRQHGGAPRGAGSRPRRTRRARPASAGTRRPPLRRPTSLHELDQPRVVVEHEDVDRRAAPGAPLDLGERRGDRLARRAARRSRRTRPRARWAVGSPSVITRITGSALRCLSRWRRASISPCCRLVPCTRSQSWSTSAPVDITRA